MPSKQAKMIESSNMWTSNVEVAACLNSWIFKINELRLLVLIRGTQEGSETCELRIATNFACINFCEIHKIRKY